MNDSTQEYLLLGLMSGSSLDGLDIAACHFQVADNKWTYHILAADTCSYPESLRKELAELNGSRNTRLQQFVSKELGRFTGHAIHHFLQENNLPAPMAISSHGHTTLHLPAEGLSIQIGDAAEIASITGLPVLYNFRNADIAAGGQGAPLVPVCDILLFNQYDICLNIGGIANISYQRNTERIGYDICAANQLLNHLAARLKLDYDADGKMAAAGKLLEPLLDALNQVSFLQQAAPRSLDNSFVRNNWIQILDAEDAPIHDLLHTATEHIAMQIARHISETGIQQPNILLTGGGVYNSYLIRRISELSGLPLSLPEHEVIRFKEALAMALMGALRLRNEPNFLPTVTGAAVAVSGGEICWPIV
jgi:anhydro-N-acetylmuramic acid kinase